MLVFAVLFGLNGCLNPNESPITDGRVQIISPRSDAVVAEMVQVEARVHGEQQVRFAELWVDDAPVTPLATIAPFRLQWSTVPYPDSSIHSLFVRVYYADDRWYDSERIRLLVNNTSARPSAPRIYAIDYVFHQFNISWSVSPDDDFQSYILYESDNPDMTGARKIDSVTTRSNTQRIIPDINDEEVRYYQVCVRDNYGLTNKSTVKRGHSLSKLLFVSDRSGGDNVYMCVSDGSDILRITTNGAPNVLPHFSADQKKIVYISAAGGNAEIMVMDLNDRQPLNISQNSADDDQAVFSPGGDLLAFISLRDGNPEIYTADVSGGGIARLTSNSTNDHSPQFSVDGNYILFVSDRNGNEDIFRANIDGSNVQNLTENPARDSGICISPDGNHIAFISNRSGSNQVYRMDLNGQNLMRLTNVSGQSVNPAYNNDGSKIVFQNQSDSDSRVYIAAADGSAPRLLTPAHADAQNPAFSIPGTFVFFESSVSGNWDIFRVDLDGNNTRNITLHSGRDRMGGSRISE